MDKQEIEKLARDYGTALLQEYSAKLKATNAMTEVERVEAVIIGAGYSDGVIDGKNADTRKAQERALLAEAQEYQIAVGAQAQADNEAAIKEIDRRQTEALVSLTKAWLYSQSGN